MRRLGLACRRGRPCASWSVVRPDEFPGLLVQRVLSHHSRDGLGPVLRPPWCWDRGHLKNIILQQSLFFKHLFKLYTWNGHFITAGVSSPLVAMAGSAFVIGAMIYNCTLLTGKIGEKYYICESLFQHLHGFIYWCSKMRDVQWLCTKIHDCAVSDEAYFSIAIACCNYFQNFVIKLLWLKATITLAKRCKTVETHFSSVDAYWYTTEQDCFNFNLLVLTETHLRKWYFVDRHACSVTKFTYVSIIEKLTHLCTKNRPRICQEYLNTRLNQYNAARQSDISDQLRP